MSERKVWLITGASRGLGAALADAALHAAHGVVATGRRPSEVAARVAPSDRLLTVRKLDVTNDAVASAAAYAAVERFGRIELLVNNAANRSRGTSRRCRRPRSPGSWR